MRQPFRLCSLFGKHNAKTYKYFAWVYEDNGHEIIKRGFDFYDYLLGHDEMKKEYEQYMKSKEKPRKYINRQEIPGNVPVHTTAYFCHTEEDFKKYTSHKAVKEKLGQSFDMELISVQLTPRTLGFRVKLPKDALDLWNFKDSGDQIALPDKEALKKFSTDVYGGKDGDIFAPHLFSTGSRAHITVGTDDENKAKQTGLDLIDIMHCEKECKAIKNYYAVCKDDKDGELKSKMRYYGSGRFVFYLDNPLKYKAKFCQLST